MNRGLPLFEQENIVKPTSPRQLKIGKISRELFIKLNREWHSRLPIVSNCFEGICYGAEFQGIIYAVAWWSKPIAQNRFKNGKEIYELRRFAIAPDSPKFTASFMLAKMAKLIKKELPYIKLLISYQDTEVHKGIIYKASGWKSNKKQKFISWFERNGYVTAEQSKADKIRWELQL